jgi:hypothetical protein
MPAQDEETTRVIIQATVPADTPISEVETQTRHLRRELREARFEQVDFLYGGAPPVGAKAAEAFALGAIAVSLAPKLLPELIDILGGWVKRREDRKLHLKLPNGLEFDVSGSMSAVDTKTLIDKLLATAGTDSVSQPKAASSSNR